MKRMDRMMAIVMALQQRPETAQSLAAKLEVSKRTVLRDMQALTEIGVPLCALPGPGGGYRLMDSYRLPPLQLDSEEALTVLLALDAMTKFSDGPFQQASWTVTDKIRSVLPEQMLGEIGPLLRHVEMEVPERHYKTPYLIALMTYSANAKWVRALYRSQNHCRYLTLRPLRIYAAHGFWYCEADSPLHGEKRTFRVDRFEEIQEISSPPETYPARGEEEKTARSTTGSLEAVHLQVKLTYRGALLTEQDPHLGHKVCQVGDEEWMLDCHLPNTEWRWAVTFFFNLGLDAEVLEPKLLREEIVERAVLLAKHYGHVYPNMPDYT